MPLPDLLALTTIAADSSLTSAPVRDNFSDIQTGFNDLIEDLDTGTDLVKTPSGVAAGDVPVWSGSAWGKPGGTRTGTNFLRDDGTYQSVVPGLTRYAKTTSKAVNTTVTATDLLNGEVTIAANVLGANKRLSAILWGDFLQNTGSAQSGPEFQLVVGGTTVVDTGVIGAARFGSETSRLTWKAHIESIASATNAQLWVVEVQIITGRTDTFSASVTQGSQIATTGTGGAVEVDQATLANFAVAQVVNSSAIDMTSSQAFVFNVINGDNSANYETRLLAATVDIT